MANQRETGKTSTGDRLPLARTRVESVRLEDLRLPPGEVFHPDRARKFMDVVNRHKLSKEAAQDFVDLNIEVNRTRDEENRREWHRLAVNHEPVRKFLQWAQEHTGAAGTAKRPTRGERRYFTSGSYGAPKGH